MFRHKYEHWKGYELGRTSKGIDRVMSVRLGEGADLKHRGLIRSAAVRRGQGP